MTNLFSTQNLWLNMTLLSTQYFTEAAETLSSKEFPADELPYFLASNSWRLLNLNLL